MNQVQYHCSNCRELIQVPQQNAVGQCSCPVCNFVEVPAPPRTKNKLFLIFQTWVIIFAVVFVVGILFSPILPLFLASIFLLCIIMIPAYLFSNVGGNLLYGKSQQYQDYKRDGGDVFWDNWLGLINQNKMHYTLPNPEPSYGDFVPPGHWKYQCLTCNARVENATGNCWCCGIKLG